MRILIHISDLHFHRVEGLVVEELLRKIHAIKPDLVAVSGDLTQRARSYQFKEAAAFLERIPFPQVVVPGNHDVPLFDPFARFLYPFAKYRKFINRNLEPVFEDEEMMVVGLCTPKSFTIAEGKLRTSSLNKFPQFFKEAHEKTRVIVSHHPLDVKILLPFSPDILLAGHLHEGSVTSTLKMKMDKHRSLLVVQGGTATSTRHRGKDGNSFNLLSLDKSNIQVERFQWRAEGEIFKAVEKSSFNLANNGWHLA